MSGYRENNFRRPMANFPSEEASRVPTLTHFSPLSMFANVVDIAAMVVVMVDELVTYLNNSPHLQAFSSLNAIPYGIGVAIYSFEGIGMVFPLEIVADKKHKFGRILGLAILLISVTYGCFGVLGYFVFGAEKRDIITLNLGKNLMTDLVQLALCINFFFTFTSMWRAYSIKASIHFS